MLTPMTAENYNLLLDPIVADRELERIDKLRELVKFVAPRLIDANVHDVLALRLIHRHHTINPGEIMVEESGRHNDRSALITKVVRQKDVDDQDIVPNVFAVGEIGYEIAEYCMSSILTDLSATEQALANEKLLTEIREKIIELGLKQVVGLGLRNKHFFHEGGDGQNMLEITDAEEHANVLLWVQSPTKGRKNIVTLWGFGPAENTAIHVQNNAATAAFRTWNGIGCDTIVECEFYYDPISGAQYHEQVYKHYSYGGLS